MFSPEVYINRRKVLTEQLSNQGQILIAGNRYSPVNYPGNVYRFRQDSNFLYFAGIDLPGLYLIIDTATGNATLYGDDITIDSAIWTGPQPGLGDWAMKSGIQTVRTISSLVSDLKKAKQLHYLPPYPYERKMFLSEVFSSGICEIDAKPSLKLIKSVINQRSIKSNPEVEQIEDSLNRATMKFHIDAMKMAKPGVFEYEIAGHIEGTMLRNNCRPAYEVICSVRGEVLHNESYNNKLCANQILLIDAGAENPMHYASDITRSIPVGGKFNNQQKNIYSIVLQTLNESIQAIRPDISYREIHNRAAGIISKGLIDLGLLKGTVDEIVNAGAHALFFPHGLGHMLGLDVHDMEDLGEDLVGYDDEITRSKIFGTANLRLAKKLQKGFVLTVEPGIYFIPLLIEKWKSEKQHTNFINYSEVEKYLDFGGIRIEDNVLVTETGRRVLGIPIPKNIEDIEAL